MNNELNLIDEYIIRKKRLTKKDIEKMSKSEYKKYLEKQLDYYVAMVNLPNLDPICKPSWNKGIEKTKKQLEELK